MAPGTAACEARPAAAITEAAAPSRQQSPWTEALLRGLLSWSDDLGALPARQAGGVLVRRLRPRHPLVILSGATPGPVYHSHPHVPAEFDRTYTPSMDGQCRMNFRAIAKIARSVTDATLPFEAPPPESFMSRPLIVHWLATGADAAEARSRRQECEASTTEETAALGMSGGEVLGYFRTAGNVTDRRFLLETFAMFALEGAQQPDDPSCVRLDIKEEYDEKYFMPYVPGFVVSGGDLLIFEVTAASSQDGRVGAFSPDGQVKAVITNMLQVLESFGSSFEDVVGIWNQVVDLDANERAVLLTRSRMGLNRPIAESVLEVSPEEVGCDAEGTQMSLKYIVVALTPKSSPWLPSVQA